MPSTLGVTAEVLVGTSTATLLAMHWKADGSAGPGGKQREKKSYTIRHTNKIECSQFPPTAVGSLRLGHRPSRLSLRGNNTRTAPPWPPPMPPPPPPKKPPPKWAWGHFALPKSPLYTMQQFNQHRQPKGCHCPTIAPRAEVQGMSMNITMIQRAASSATLGNPAEAGKNGQRPGNNAPESHTELHTNNWWGTRPLRLSALPRRHERQQPRGAACSNSRPQPGAKIFGGLEGGGGQVGRPVSPRGP